MSAAQDLRRRIEGKDVLVGVVGLGYVGLPLALSAATRGFKVLGFDVDRAKIEALAEGRSYLEHIPSREVRAALGNGGLSGTVDFSRLDEPDVVLICVPTPLTEDREPDMRYVEETARAIRERLRVGQLVILESTTYPGTTDTLLRGILEESGLACGKDFFLAYSPEREDPGNPEFGTPGIPKVVGGVDPLSADLAERLYRQLVVQTVPVTDAKTAEATKLLENIFRAVNIALVNELKMVFDPMGIDIWEVIDAASTKPFGFMKFTPGPGWGGHCIPIDPFYLSWKARQYGMAAQFIELAGSLNLRMPVYVVEKLEAALEIQGKELSGSRVLVLGLSYKPDIGDPRESPSFEILSELRSRGATVSYHDPHVPEAPAMRSWPELPPLRSQPLTREVLRGHDAVIVATAHRAVDYELVREHASCIVDTRGLFRDKDPKVFRA